MVCLQIAFRIRLQVVIPAGQSELHLVQLEQPYGSLLCMTNTGMNVGTYWAPFSIGYQWQKFPQSAMFLFDVAGGQDVN
jgi:hypothetical protein